MIRSPLFSEVAARYGLQLLNCDAELAKRRYCDFVLVLDTKPQPWQDFFVRAKLLTPDSDWRMFVLDYRGVFDLIILGNDRLPSWVLPPLLKETGMIVDVRNDQCLHKNQLDI